MSRCARITRFAEVQRAQHAPPTPEAPHVARADVDGDDAVAETGPMLPRTPYTDTRMRDPSAMILAAPRLRVITIPNGTRLDVEVEAQRDVAPLRRELREDATALQQGRCPLSLQVETGA